MCDPSVDERIVLGSSCVPIRESVKRVRMSTACTFIHIKKIKSKKVKGKILIAYFPFRNVYKMQTFRVNYFINEFTCKL